jgi:hypothetical protein
MELVAILRALWRFRLLVALSAIAAAITGCAMTYQLGFPPTSRQYEIGLGSATALVDTPSSQVVDLGGDTGADIATLAARSTLLASLITSSPLKDEIASRAGVARDKLIAIPPSGGAVGATGTGTVSGASVRETDREANILRAKVPTLESGDIPIIAVETQSPDAAVAAKLADASFAVLKEHLRSVAGVDRVPDARRLVVTQLGPARSAVAGRGPKPATALLAAMFVFGLGCVSILGVNALIDGWRRAAVMELFTDDDEFELFSDEEEFEPDEPLGAEPSVESVGPIEPPRELPERRPLDEAVEEPVARHSGAVGF